MKKRISFDYDGTLDELEVQEIAKKLLKNHKSYEIVFKPL